MKPALPNASNISLKSIPFPSSSWSERRTGPPDPVVLETTAAVHDIGIRKSLEVYGSYTGKTQEELGPAEARRPSDLYRLSPGNHRPGSWIVGRHHTYTDIQGLDYQILVEAGFPGQPLREGRGRGGPARRL